MFDITSSKLLILGIVALLVIGPKDLPALLRTIGKYMGIIKRHAAEFRAQFDEAMRESELEQLKKDVEKIGTETEATMRAAEQLRRQGARRGAPGRRCADGQPTPSPPPIRWRTTPTALPVDERRTRGGRRRRPPSTAPPCRPSRPPTPAADRDGGRRARQRRCEDRRVGRPCRTGPTSPRGTRRDRGVQGAADGSPDRAAPAPDLCADRHRHRLRASASPSPRRSTTCWCGPIRWRAGRGRRSR